MEEKSVTGGSWDGGEHKWTSSHYGNKVSAHSVQLIVGGKNTDEMKDEMEE